MIDLGEAHFDSELMWARLRAYRSLGLPMGCGTNNAEGHNLREVGLVGGHAYSILDVREAVTRTGEVVRLLRVRNPHGCTEWNGEWSDSSDMWSELIGSLDVSLDNAGSAGPSSAVRPLCPYGKACYRKNPAHFAEYCHEAPALQPTSGFERTGVDDGTFWVRRQPTCTPTSPTRPPHRPAVVPPANLLQTCCEPACAPAANLLQTCMARSHPQRIVQTLSRGVWLHSSALRGLPTCR